MSKQQANLGKRLITFMQLMGEQVVGWDHKRKQPVMFQRSYNEARKLAGISHLQAQSLYNATKGL